MKPKSLYGNGSFKRKIPVVKNVGQLKKLLAELPDELPLGSEGLKPRWFNVGIQGHGSNREHLEFDENDFSNW